MNRVFLGVQLIEASQDFSSRGRAVLPMEDAKRRQLINTSPFAARILGLALRAINNAEDLWRAKSGMVMQPHQH